MRREQLTDKILDIKRSKGWSWKHITEEIGGVSPVLVIGALLGQMKLVKPLAKKAAELFGLTDDEERMLNEVPNRGTPMPPTDPLLYRFYELVMVNGPALKALIEEEFGDGITSPSISTWRSSACRILRGTGSRSPCPANSCRTSITVANKESRNTAPKKRTPSGPSSIDVTGGRRPAVWASAPIQG
jgi:cyanate lyase